LKRVTSLYYKNISRQDERRTKTHSDIIQNFILETYPLLIICYQEDAI